MVYCVAVGCRSQNNRTANGDKISFHTFPKDKKLRKAWELKVSRKNWSVDKCSPKAAVLCGLHFEPDQFTVNPVVAKSCGFNPGSLQLKPDSIPTLFDHTAKEPTPGPATTKKRRYCERRDREELLQTLLTTDANADLENDTAITTQTHTQTTIPETFPETAPEPPIRIIHPFTYAPAPTITQAPCTTADKKTQSKADMKTKSTQTPPFEPPIAPTSPVTLPFHEVQPSKECRCKCDDSDGSDTSSTSPQKLPHITRSGRKTWVRKVSFDDGMGPDEDEFCPQECDNDSSESEDENDENSEIPSSDPKTERKYIVFESKLMDLLKHCQRCGAPAKVKSGKTWGTMLQCEIDCEKGHSMQWCSQPVHSKLA